MKKNTKWVLENKTNYEKIFEDKREKKLDLEVILVILIMKVLLLL